MKKVMEILAQETNGKSYNTEKYSFETIQMPSFDYDDDPNRIMKWESTAETIKYKRSVDLSKIAKKIENEPSILTYFLDGSRHTYKVDDMSYNKQVYPVIAGQIGVGCCKRINRQMKRESFVRKLVVALPNVANASGWNDEGYFGTRLDKLNQSPFLKKMGLQFDKILWYEKPHDKRKGRIEDNGIAKVQDYMIESEKEMVAQLVQKRKLNQDNYLVKDGSLEYKVMKSGKKELRELQRIKHNYEWVIGVSKSFNPESILDHKGKPNANYIADLPLYHRTPVALYENPEFTGEVKFAVWYIRIRDKAQTRTPFDGVIKVEKILLEDEIDSETVDLISANLINERNPTCYGKDKRWANHLYPIYLTESFVKSMYLSKEMFLYLF